MNAQINSIAVAFQKEIDDLRRKIREKEDLLRSLQEICGHPNVEKYRGYHVGQCNACLALFATTRQVDEIFQGS